MTPQEAAEQYAISRSTYVGGFPMTACRVNSFIAGQQWQSEQDRQALSSALKEIAELHAKIKELENKPNNFM